MPLTSFPLRPHVSAFDETPPPSGADFPNGWPFKVYLGSTREC